MTIVCTTKPAKSKVANPSRKNFLDPSIQSLGTAKAARANFKPPLCQDPHILQLSKLLKRHVGNLNSICDRAGVHYQTIARWRAGARNPNLMDFKAVLEVLGYQIQIIRNGEGQ